MACISPVTAYFSKTVNPSGKRSLVYSLKEAYDGNPVMRPCGKCINCRIQDASDKTVRFIHESKSHEANCFVTLTYSDKFLPEDGSLNHRHFQLFMKRLRFVSDFKFKFYMCGEYGEKLDRPHYHALLFGCDFSDRVFYKKNKRGDNLDTSARLESLWQLGLCTVGSITQQSARYVAGYVTKKIDGDVKDDWYGHKLPEYGRGSNGLGLEYLVKYGSQWMDTGFIIIEGSKYRIPRYYDEKYKAYAGMHFDVVKDERFLAARAAPVDSNFDGTYNRFVAVDTSVKAKLKLGGRDYED